MIAKGQGQLLFAEDLVESGPNGLPLFIAEGFFRRQALRLRIVGFAKRFDAPVEGGRLPQPTPGEFAEFLTTPLVLGLCLIQQSVFTIDLFQLLGEALFATRQFLRPVGLFVEARLPVMFQLARSLSRGLKRGLDRLGHLVDDQRRQCRRRGFRRSANGRLGRAFEAFGRWLGFVIERQLAIALDFVSLRLQFLSLLFQYGPVGIKFVMPLLDFRGSALGSFELFLDALASLAEKSLFLGKPLATLLEFRPNRVERLVLGPNLREIRFEPGLSFAEFGFSPIEELTSLLDVGVQPSDFRLPSTDVVGEPTPMGDLGFVGGTVLLEVGGATFEVFRHRGKMLMFLAILLDDLLMNAVQSAPFPFIGLSTLIDVDGFLGRPLLLSTELLFALEDFVGPLLQFVFLLGEERLFLGEILELLFDFAPLQIKADSFLLELTSIRFRKMGFFAELSALSFEFAIRFRGGW